jgi:hypothetical protein
MSDRLSQVVAIALLVTALGMGGGFGNATAEVTVVDSRTVEIAVSVEGASGGQVVMHVLDPGGDQQTIAMLETSPGVHRTRLDTRPIDWVVVFENLGTGEQSDALRLTEIGAAPELLGVIGAMPGPEPEPEDRSLLWLGAALGAASLSALAFWVLGGEKRQDDSDGPVEGVG